MGAKDGNIPVKFVSEESIPEAFEKAMEAVWTEGISMPTEYDIKEETPGGRQDPPSKDATVMIEVKNPFKEPRIPKAFSDSLENLGKYIHEVVSGIRDYRIKPREEKADESSTHWTYTYHQRLENYGTSEGEINQIDYLVDKLSETPHTRRAQAIIWDPEFDCCTSHPACLQRVHCRMVKNSEGIYVLNMNTHWRSRDLFKAWVENVIALTELQSRIAARISERIKQKVLVGRYVDITDSLHIYGSYFDKVEGYFSNLGSRPKEDRAWTTDFAKPFFKEGLEELLKEEGSFMTEEKKTLLKQEIKLLDP